MSLKDVDDRLLPGMGRRVAALVARLPRPGEPSGPAPFIVRLRRLDDRWGQRGPLAMFREVPQVASVLLGLLVFVGGLTLRVRLHERDQRQTAAATPSAEPATPPDTSHHLGPGIGDRVSEYLAKAQANLVRTAGSQPDGTAVAVVSFRSYLTPEAVLNLVGPLQVRWVFFRAPLPLGQTSPGLVPVQDLVRDTRKDMLRLATVRAAAARELRTVAATTDDVVQKNDELRDAKTYEREAAILRGPCACVYAVVVRTRLRLLLDVARAPGVRAVDTSRSGGMLADYDYSGLLPEEKVVVTGGNQSR